MSSGHHEAAWRLPESDPHADFDVDALDALSPQLAERGKFDSLFLADGPALWRQRRVPPGRAARAADPADRAGGGDRAHRPDRHRLDDLQRAVQPGPPLRLARPRQRRPGRLEHRHHRRSRRRAQLRARRPARPRATATSGRPSSSTCRSKLWDSWDDDAILADKATGRLRRRRTGSTAIDHARRLLPASRGPLNVPRSPQGHPLLVQAGSSEDGKEFAARYAEAVFTAQQTLADGQAFYADLKARGRPRTAATRTASRSCPGSCPVLGSTEAEARRWTQRARRADRARVRAAPARPSLLEVPIDGCELDAAAARRDLRPATTIEGRAEPLHADRRTRPARAADRPPAARRGSAAAAATGRSSARPSRSPTRSSSGSSRAPPTASTSWAGAAVVARAVRRARRAAPAAARAVPHRVRRPHAARPLRDPPTRDAPATPVGP